MASKKDYQAVAAVIYRAHREFPAEAPVRVGDKIEWPGVLGVVVFELDGIYRADNPLYDSRRFLEACETGRCKGMRQVGEAADASREGVA